jgi:two-component system cell cycle sensor histidine kinase/response regulator CckA
MTGERPQRPQRAEMHSIFKDLGKDPGAEEASDLPGFTLPLLLVVTSLMVSVWVVRFGDGLSDVLPSLIVATVAVVALLDRVRVRREVKKLDEDRLRILRHADERRRYLDSLIEHSPLATVVLDAEHRVRMVNPAFSKLFGYQQHEVIGTRLDELIAGPEQQIEAGDYTRRVFSGEQVHRTLRRRRKDGTPVDVELYGVPLHEDGRLVGIFALYEDATDRVDAEHKLRESEERFRRLADATFEGIVVSDAGTVIDCNEQFARLLGLTPKEVIGRQVLDFVAPEHHALVTERIRTGDEQPYEHRALLPDGSVLLVEVHGRTLPQAGRTLRVTAVRDVTSHRRFEEEIRQGQKMEAVGRLAGGIAHDFNNVLTVIKGYSQLVAMQLQDDRLRGQVEEIKQAAERAGLMTQRLLAFGRKQPLQPQVIDLNAAIMGMEKMLRRLIRADIQFEFQLKHGLGQIKVDPGQLEQVILNLAINAGDAMPRGGSLRFRTSEKEEKESLPSRAGGSYVVLEVSDTGTGMDEETLRQAFEPFFTTKQNGKGTGLGLATVYAIVKQSGGSIDAISRLGAGTTFCIYLPRVPAEKGPEATTTGDRELPRGEETILVVEDEPGVRSLAVEFLSRHGYQVLEAENGNRALELFAREGQHIDLVLTDVVMPGMNGPEMVEHLLALRPELKVLFMSGYTDDVLPHDSGFESFRLVQKPFSVEELIVKLRETLDGVPGTGSHQLPH